MTDQAAEGGDRRKIFLTEWSSLENRWDPNYYRYMREFRRRMADCVFPIDELRHSVELIQYGISERATQDPIGTPMLRMINLQDDSWDLRDLKYIDLDEQERAQYLLKPGDILFNRTNSKELVGKCGVFDVSGDFVFASYLIRVRVKRELLLPNYLTAFFSSTLGRLQIDAVSRQIAGMTNINAEEIRALVIPLADAGTQEQVAARWKEAIKERDDTIDEARKTLATVEAVLLDELGIVVPQEDSAINSRVFVGKFEGLSGRRWDPFRYLPHQIALRTLVKSAAAVPSRPLRECLSHMTAGEWGDDDADVFDAALYERCLVIRNTEFDNDFNLQFESGREKRRLIPKPKLQALNILPGDLLVEKSGGSIDQPVGRAAILMPEHFGPDPLCFSNFLLKIRAKPDVVNPLYLYYWLRASHRIGITASMQSQTSGIRNLIMDEYLGQDVPLPSLAEQRRIVGRLEQITATAQTLRARAFEEFERHRRDIERLILGVGE